MGGGGIKVRTGGWRGGFNEEPGSAAAERAVSAPAAPSGGAARRKGLA